MSQRRLARPFAELSGTGSYAPPRVMTNDEFSKILDTSDQWIRERTGIRERRVSTKEETNACMGKAAALQVLEQNHLTPADLDAIVYATASPDRLLPSQACDLQAILGAKNAAAFDVGAACAGFVYALNVAEGLVASGQGETVLVIAAEKLTSIMDWSDRTTAVLFGDGAGATLVKPATGQRGILSNYMKSDGTLAELLYRPGGGASHPPSPALLQDHSYFIKMAGREVFKAAVLSMADACDQALQRAGLSAKDIDLLIPHQANIRIIEATAKHAGVPMDKVYVNVDRFGNTSAASIAIALDEAVKTGRLQPGMTVMFVAFGAGFTWASMVVRW
jgi:3-oxoacyl-[acyl-carrier-protein] synthase III